MSRSTRDKAYRTAFGLRLRCIVEHLDMPLAELAEHLGYGDSSTLSSAMAGRCGVDLERLATLADWSRHYGTPVDLHWLLTGRDSPAARTPRTYRTFANWLTPARRAALATIADGVPSLPGADATSK